ncbi:hypothetical protein BKI52_11310 [marine bacterium AO1-C]|nr:hypothetical protein BKI52_11310 [marine bacterium AO1-C]
MVFTHNTFYLKNSIAIALSIFWRLFLRKYKVKDTFSLEPHQFNKKLMLVQFTYLFKIPNI